MAFTMTLAVETVYGVWAMLQFEIKNDGGSQDDDGSTIVYGILYSIVYTIELYMVWATLPQCFNSSALQPHRTVTRRKRRKLTCIFSLINPKNTKMA